jgi:outer membrane protein assembly factor BamA
MRYLFAVLLLFGLVGISVGADESTIVVRNFTLVPSDKLSPEGEQFVVQEIKSHNYKSTNPNEIAERVRYGFQRLGYFKVVAHDPALTVVSRDNGSEVADVSVKVDVGQIYRLKTIAFTGVNDTNPSELRSQFPIADGDILDLDKIAAGLEGLRRVYVAKGYPNFSPVPDTEIDEKAHVISLVVDLDPGVRQADSAQR